MLPIAIAGRFRPGRAADLRDGRRWLVPARLARRGGRFRGVGRQGGIGGRPAGGGRGAGHLDHHPGSTIMWVPSAGGQAPKDAVLEPRPSLCHLWGRAGHPIKPAITANLLRTGILLAALTALFMGIGFLVGGQSGMLLALVAAAAMNLFAYWNSGDMVLGLYGAHEVDRHAAP